MEKHVHILMANYMGGLFVRGVFETFHEAKKAKDVMEAKALNMTYSISTYRVWESLEQAQREETL